MCLIQLYVTSPPSKLYFSKTKKELPLVALFYQEKCSFSVRAFHYHLGQKEFRASLGISNNHYKPLVLKEKAEGRKQTGEGRREKAERRRQKQQP